MQTADQKSASRRRLYERHLAERRAVVSERKDNPCADCGGRFPECAMDFDHVRGIKVADVSTMVSRRYPIAVLLEELDKCDLICANCHRVRTKARGITGMRADGSAPCPPRTSKRYRTA